MDPLLVYLILINAAGFMLMLADKQKARQKAWRIAEAVLIGTAVIGGSVGILLGMHAFRHKTRRPKFSVGVPLIFTLQILLAVWIMTK